MGEGRGILSAVPTLNISGLKKIFLIGTARKDKNKTFNLIKMIQAFSSVT